MTREEAKALLGSTALLMFEHNGSSTLDGDKTLHIIDKIFDEHEADIKDKYKEIERLESRVYALENDTIVQNMEQRLIDISLVINGELTSKDNAWQQQKNYKTLQSLFY